MRKVNLFSQIINKLDKSVFKKLVKFHQTDDVKAIEVITNPSAEFYAEDNYGLIQCYIYIKVSLQRS